MKRLRDLPSGLPLAVLAAAFLVLLPTLFVALLCIAGPDAAGGDDASMLSAAPATGASRIASLADTVRLEALAPAPRADALAPAGGARPARQRARSTAQSSSFPSPADASRRL